MLPTSAPDGADRVQDEPARRRVLARLEGAPSPWLHQEVARRMAERLPLFRLQPGRILVWDAPWGGGREHVEAAFPRAACVAVASRDRPAPPAPGGARGVRTWVERMLGARPAVPPVPEAHVQAGGAGLVWSNMGLHHAGGVRDRIAAWHRALEPDGLLMFTTLGPGSLDALRAVHAELDAGPAFAAFVDMHDIGDRLVEAGFADPVMDQEVLTITWSSADAMLAELRTLGGNTHAGRFPGLRTPRWLSRWREAASRLAVSASAMPAVAAGAAPAGPGREGARVALRFEVVYGHAFKARPRADRSGQTNIPLQEMRASLRGRRSTGDTGADPVGRPGALG